MSGGLPAREADVLAGLADDLSEREIGARLFLSLSTVQTYRRALYARLGVSSRLEALRTAWWRGLLQTCPTCRRPQ